MNTSYKRLGYYIQLVNVRNSGLKATELLGINIDKFFMPSVANVVGTDLSVYKIVNKNQFACNRMHVGRDYRLPISMSKSEEQFMVSPAYDVFEITDTAKLDPEYLMMWFSRKEFDRNAWFFTDADVRGGLSWEAFTGIELPVPPLAKQLEIVKEYNTVVNRIKLNQQLIQKLEETAQAIYKQWFVDFEFPDENWLPYKSNGGKMVWCEELGKKVPRGWKIKSFTQIIKLSGGGTPDTNNEKYWNGNIPFFTPADVVDSCYSIKTEKNITELGLKYSSTRLYPKNTVFVTARGTVGAISVAGCEMTMNQSCYAITGSHPLNQFFVHQLTLDAMAKLKNEAVGAVFAALVTKDFESQDMVEPNQELIQKFDKLVSPVYDLILTIVQQNQKLSELKDLLLSKLATIP
jgi:type I restriction enzyme, S subunit